MDVVIIHQGSLVGKMFTRYPMKVLDIIKELSLDNNSEICIKGLKCCREDIQELQDNYYVTPQGAQRKKVDRYDLKKIFYKNETNFTFENYVTKLKGIFNVLDKYGVLIYE